MQYCEHNYDMFLVGDKKSGFLDEIEQLTLSLGSEERKSSITSVSNLGSSWLFDFESDNHPLPFLEAIEARPCSPVKELQPPAKSAEDRQNKNETKNIPKNYGKAILGYIQKNKPRCCKLLTKMGMNVQNFFEFLQDQSTKINSIADLRWLWKDNEFSEPLRILSYEFMRKHSLPYIFRSRIKNHLTHIKYREKFMDGLRKPDSFRNIKDY